MLSTMLDLSTFALFLATFALSYVSIQLANKGRKERRSLPCLPYLPIVGSLPFLPRDIGTVPVFLFEKAAKLGSIFAMYSGKRYTVVLNGRDAIAAAYLKHPTDFADREPMYVDKHFTNLNDKGLSMKRYTPHFVFNRRITLQILKEFGFGSKNIMGNRILVEVEKFVEEAKKMNSRPFKPDVLLMAAISNVFINIILGTRFDYEDEKLHIIDQCIHEIIAAMQPMLNVFPIMRFRPDFKRKLDKCRKAMFTYLDLINAEIKKSITNSNADSFVKSYVEKCGPDYDHEQLLYMTRDLIGAGTDTTVATLLWGLIAFANNPRAQELLHQEIDSVVPKGRLPSSEDQSKLAYLEAAIIEVTRWRTLIPLSVLRATTCNSEVNGFFVPTETIIIANLYSAHMDPIVWPEPEVFKPERFLDRNGKVYGRNRVIPFGMGKRSCLGEGMARQELFLFLAGILQQFDILPPEGQQYVEIQTEGELVVSPKPFDIRLVPRH